MHDAEAQLEICRLLSNVASLPDTDTMSPTFGSAVGLSRQFLKTPKPGPPAGPRTRLAAAPLAPAAMAPAGAGAAPPAAARVPPAAGAGEREGRKSKSEQPDVAHVLLLFLKRRNRPVLQRRTWKPRLKPS